MHRRLAIPRLLARLRFVAAFTFAVVLFGSGSKAGSCDYWSQLFLATFDGFEDGPVTSSTVSVDAGKLSVVVPSGRTIADVAPKSGIYDERLLLSDLGTNASAEFGVDLGTVGDAPKGAWLSFDLRQESDCTAFGGDVSDGATIDMLCFNVSGGAVTVNDQPLKTKVHTGTVYHVDVYLTTLAGFGDFWTFSITNSDSGEQEWTFGWIADGYRPVHTVGLRKHAGKAGAVSFDSIQLLGLDH